MKFSKKKKPLRPLMNHQEDIVDYLSERASKNRGGALFVEMRLGKTLSIIRFLAPLKMRVLVIAPLVVCKTWELELKTDGEKDVSNIGGLPKQKKLKALESTQAKWTIVNYESARLLDIHKYFGPDTAIVLDESIAIANPSAQVTKYFLSKRNWPQWAKYVLCGNPAPEGNLQYVTQSIFYNGSFCLRDSYWKFRAAKYEMFGFDWNPKEGTSKEIYAEVHGKAFILTRQQAGIGSKKIYEKRYVKTTPKQRRAYAEMLADFETDDVETMYITVQMLYLSRIAGGMKLQNPDKPDEPIEWHSEEKFKEVLALLSGELKGEQCIIWFRFKAELYKMEQMLRERGYSLCTVHGDVKFKDREQRRRDFMVGKYQLTLMTISTAKRGLDWSSADTEIYFSNDYSADARTQSEDRIVHPKKTNPLLVIDLISEETIDEHVCNLLEEKGIGAKLFMSKLLGKLFRL